MGCYLSKAIPQFQNGRKWPEIFHSSRHRARNDAAELVVDAQLAAHLTARRGSALESPHQESRPGSRAAKSYAQEDEDSS